MSRDNVHRIQVVDLEVRAMQDEEAGPKYRVAFACHRGSPGKLRGRRSALAALLPTLIAAIAVSTGPAQALPCPDGSQTCGPTATQGPMPTQGNQAPTTAPQAPNTTIPGYTPPELPAPTQGGVNTPTLQGTVMPMPTVTAPPDSCILNCTPTQAPAPTVTTAPKPPGTPTPRPGGDQEERSAATSTRYELVAHNSFSKEDTQPRFDACFSGARGPNFLITVFDFTFINLDKKEITGQQLDLACGSEAGGLIHIRDDHDTWGNSPQDVPNCIGNILDFSGGTVRKATSAGHLVASWQGNEVVFNEKTGVIKTAYPATSWAACASAAAGPWHPVQGAVY